MKEKIKENAKKEMKTWDAWLLQIFDSLQKVPAFVEGLTKGEISSTPSTVPPSSAPISPMQASSTPAS